MGKKVKGRSGARGGGGGSFGVPASKIKTAAERKAERQAARVPAQDGEKAPAPFGLPAGWTATKHTYHSGKYKGKTYFRFIDAAKKYADKNVCTVTQAIRKDAADKGSDPKLALDKLEAHRLETEKKSKEGGSAAKEQKAVEAFRAKYGRLDRNTVCHLPGWSSETYLLDPLKNSNVHNFEFQPDVGQKATRYNGPKGEKFNQIRQVEALLGAAVLAGSDGELTAAIARAKEMGKEEVKIVKSKVQKRRAGLVPARGKRAAKGKKMDVDGTKKKVVNKKIKKKKGGK